MTVSSSVNKVTYSGNSATTVFPVNFYFLANSHIKVVLVSNNIETVQTITSQYTVTGAGNPAGGSVTMLTPPATGTQLIIVRNVPATQETDYLANDPFPAESHERALDKLTMLVQQVELEADRALKIPLSSLPTTSTELPVPSASKLLAWNSNASAITNLDPADVISVVGQQNSYADVFTGNGVTTSFTLTRNPGTVFNIDVSINGVTQVPNVDYILAATTLTFTSAPPAVASQVLARYSEVFALASADADNVRYVPAGSGAVATNVQAKLRETVSVKDFGAVGDGLTDDTAAIQAALDAAANRQVPAVVYLPSGAYRITSTLKIASTISMVGEYSGVGPPPAQITGVTLFADNSLSGYILENAQLTLTPSSPGWLSGRLENISFRQDPSAGRTASGFKMGTAADMSKLFNVKFTNLDVGLYLGGATSALQTQLALNCENISLYNCNKAVFLDRCNYSMHFKNIMFDGVLLGIHAYNCNISTHVSIQQMHTELVPIAATELIHIDDCIFGVFSVRDFDVDATTGPVGFALIKKSRVTAIGRPSIRISEGTVIGNTPLLLNDTQDLVTYPVNGFQRGIDLAYDYLTYAGQGNAAFAKFENSQPAAIQFTPVISDAPTGGNLGTATVVGRYYRNGPVINVTVQINNINTAGMTAGNTLYIQGLPVAASSGITRQVGAAACSGVTGTPDRCTIGATSQNALRLYKSGGVTDVIVADVTSGSNTIFASIAYMVL